MVAALLLVLNFTNGCPDTWAYQPEPPAVEETEACVRYFVESVYGHTLDPGSIDMDVPAGAGEMLKLARTQIDNAATAIGAVCSLCTTDTCDWRDTYCLRFAAANRLFKREAEARASLIDAGSGIDTAPLLATIVKGGALNKHQLLTTGRGHPLSPLSLWRLRNAVYARHGRPFQNPDLPSLFYGKGGCCKEQPDFSPDKLTNADRANVKLIASLEKTDKPDKKVVVRAPPRDTKTMAQTMVPVPATTFMRACSAHGYDGACTDQDADKHHAIPTSIAPFMIDKYEVTTGDYRACVKAKACEPPRYALGQEKGLLGEIANADKVLCNWNQKNEEHPENCVSAGQAQTYCEWAGKRLPSAGEWELAARGPKGDLWPSGDTAPSCEAANLAEAGASVLQADMRCRKGTVPVTKVEASRLGVVGMAGNVNEWTMDLSPADYKGTQSRIRVARGGSWLTYGNLFVRVETPMVGALGFRCAVSAPTP